MTFSLDPLATDIRGVIKIATIIPIRIFLFLLGYNKYKKKNSIEKFTPVEAITPIKLNVPENAFWVMLASVESM